MNYQQQQPGFNTNIPLHQNQPPQQGGGVNPMAGLNAYRMASGGEGVSGLFGGGGSVMSTEAALANAPWAAEGGAVAGGTGAGVGGAGASGGIGAAAGGGSGVGGASGGAALMSNPFGWIAAAALTQNYWHNKDISKWSDAAKGTSARKAGDYYFDKWGMGDTGKDFMGLLGWGSGGGYFNPSKINEKIFGD